MKKLRSDITREGLHRMPHRAVMRAKGLDDAAIQKPTIGGSSAADRLPAPRRLRSQHESSGAKRGG
jgi:dihydroxy-acid dehydratase